MGTERRNLLILIGLAGLLFFFKLGSFSLYDAAETTYGEFVKNMLQMGDWLTLHYNGAVIFDKPPLYYWFVSLLSLLFGFNEWTMRLPAALSGVLTVAVTYLFGKKMYNEKVGFLAALVVMTAFQFLVQSRIAELDIVLTLLMTTSLWLFYRRSYLGMYWPLGLAVLIKGLLGVALPAFAIFLFLLIKKDLSRLKEMKLLPGLLIILIVGTPWYLAEYLIHGQVFLDFAVGFLFLSRFQGAVSGHAGPWYYYFFALLLGFAPWSQFLPLGLRQSFKNWKNDPELLSLCFILPAFIVFSIAQTKIPNYVLPLYPFLAIMVGKLWADLLEDPAKSRKGMLISVFSLLIVVLLLVIGATIAIKANYTAELQTFTPSLIALGIVLLAGSLSSVLFFILKQYRHSFAVIPLTTFILAFILTTFALPLAEQYKGAKPLGEEIAKVIKPGEKIGAYNVGNRPSIVLHSPRPVVFLETAQQAASFRGYLFTTDGRYGKITFSQGDLKVIYKP